VIQVLNWAVVIFAAVAAGCWLKSAIVPLPTKITVGYGGTGGTVQEQADALREQSRWSAAGAVAASLSAMCQAGSMALIMQSFT
jgi:hypothetical protein